jgi:hypothetical protein
MFGRTEDNTKAVGRMANSTEKVFINKQMVKKEEVFGKMEREQNG